MSEKNDFQNIRGILSNQKKPELPGDMSDRVLAAWKVEEIKSQEKRPLVPVWFFRLLIVGLATLFMGSIFSSGSAAIYIPSNVMQLLSFEISDALTDIELSTTVYAALSCLILVLYLQMIYIGRVGVSKWFSRSS